MEEETFMGFPIKRYELRTTPYVTLRCIQCDNDFQYSREHNNNVPKASLNYLPKYCNIDCRNAARRKGSKLKNQDKQDK